MSGHEPETMGKEKRLRRSDLLRCFLIWETTSESCLSYERLMSLGFCHAMTPIINRLYKTKEERAAALKRHMVFFNTENNWGGLYSRHCLLNGGRKGKRRPGQRRDDQQR